MPEKQEANKYGFFIVAVTDSHLDVVFAYTEKGCEAYREKHNPEAMHCFPISTSITESLGPVAYSLKLIGMTDEQIRDQIIVLLDSLEKTLEKRNSQHSWN